MHDLPPPLQIGQCPRLYSFAAGADYARAGHTLNDARFRATAYPAATSFLEGFRSIGGKP